MAQYWITKYALSSGITPIDIPAQPDDDGYISYIQRNPWLHHLYRKNDWHSSFEEAAKRADEMRIAKIQSLKKQITKLEGKTFSPATPVSP